MGTEGSFTGGGRADYSSSCSQNYERLHLRRGASEQTPFLALPPTTPR